MEETSGGLQPNALPKERSAVRSVQAAQGFIQLALEHLQGQSLRSFTGQPAVSSSHHEEPLSTRSITLPWVLSGSCSVPSEPIVVQAEQVVFLKPLLTGQELQHPQSPQLSSSRFAPVPSYLFCTGRLKTGHCILNGA